MVILSSDIGLTRRAAFLISVVRQGRCRGSLALRTSNASEHVHVKQNLKGMDLHKKPQGRWGVSQHQHSQLEVDDDLCLVPSVDRLVSSPRVHLKSSGSSFDFRYAHILRHLVGLLAKFRR
jgi:hypothetical protein